MDHRTFGSSSDEERLVLERNSIERLKGPQSEEYYRAINTVAALRSTNAIPALRKIAFERREKANRDRWMAVRALAILNDRSSTRDFIQLLYHPNANTRWWAQIALVRVTGANLKGSWQNWERFLSREASPHVAPIEIARWSKNQVGPDELEKELALNDEEFLQSLR
jgi:hypothetical protein